MFLKHMVLLFLTMYSLAKTANADLVYTLDSDADFTSIDFGFSGSITTDGTLGQFSTALPIIDWSITLNTPDSSDAIATQLLTPNNSTMTFTPSGSSQLNFTPLDISISNSEATLPAVLSFDAGDEQLDVNGPFAFAPVFSIGISGMSLALPMAGGYTIQDSSESVSRSKAVAGNEQSLSFAGNGASVPEPGGWAYLTLVTVAAFACRWCHRRRMSLSSSPTQ